MISNFKALVFCSVLLPLANVACAAPVTEGEQSTASAESEAPPKHPWICSGIVSHHVLTMKRTEENGVPKETYAVTVDDEDMFVAPKYDVVKEVEAQEQVHDECVARASAQSKASGVPDAKEGIAKVRAPNGKEFEFAPYECTWSACAADF